MLSNLALIVFQPYPHPPLMEYIPILSGKYIIPLFYISFGLSSVT